MGDIRDTERRQKYLAQTNEQFAALGKYVQAFEQVCFTLRHLITSLLMQNGLKDQSLLSTFLFHQSVTARVLLDSACAMLFHLHGDDEHLVEIATDLRKRFEKEIERRNTYLHGTWFIGWASEDQQDFSEITAFKGTASPARGLGLKQLAASGSELHQRVEALEEISDAFWRLFGCIMGEFPVAKNFLTYEGRYVSPDTARKRGWKIANS